MVGSWQRERPNRRYGIMLHIDGDIIAYRIACAIGDEGEAKAVTWTLNSYVVKSILQHFPELTKYHVYLTGGHNFRNEIAVTAPYKGNRTGPKPIHLRAARQHMIDFWGALVYNGIEADDAIATGATRELKEGTVPVIVSLDKDFDQIACDRYDMVNDVTTSPDQLEATRNLYKQIIMGDAVDNIIGMYLCGKALAAELLDGLTSELDMALTVIDQMGYTRAYENAQLVYLRRSLSDRFSFPVETKEFLEWDS
jgi:hypothetical protein|tara:strand:- start:9264 stop:10022 length:759 start_codon:yes stop_codon:yes gene_type:complete